MNERAKTVAELPENSLGNVLQHPNAGIKSTKVLWTGGWDSTFRIVELSMTDVTIEPIYVRDPNRLSIDIEIKAMHSIMRALKAKSGTKAKFLPIKMVDLSDIPPNAEITNAFESIRKVTHLGSQHEWLARLGAVINGMEIGTEAGTAEISRIIDTIERYSTMIFKDGIGELDPKKSTKEGMLVLGWFRFPIITRIEKDMERLINEWGYQDVMKLIWFCHSPINGKTCGFCHPCHVKMESGMGWLLNEKARNNYKIHKRLEHLLGVRISNKYAQIMKKLQQTSF